MKTNSKTPTRKRTTTRSKLMSISNPSSDETMKMFQDMLLELKRGAQALNCYLTLKHIKAFVDIFLLSDVVIGDLLPSLKDKADPIINKIGLTLERTLQDYTNNEPFYGFTSLECDGILMLLNSFGFADAYFEQPRSRQTYMRRMFTSIGEQRQERGAEFNIWLTQNAGRLLEIGVLKMV